MTLASTMTMSNAPYDVERIRQDFPILSQKVRGKRLVYLDNAATTQKPQSVIDRLRDYYTTENANVHRGVHALSERATQAYETARKRVQSFVHAASTRNIVFTRGTTESINLVAQSYARSLLKPGDEILITHMEHHSNIVPWQLVCEQTGAVLKVAPINDAGECPLTSFKALLSERTKMVSVVHLSNALGTINPIEEMISAAHALGARVLIDAAQSVAHMPIDVQHLDCDFLAFSGHKVYGPTGIGVLYAKEALLDAMPPYQGGGEMIAKVSFAESTYNEIPFKFEAGTPHIAGAVGLATALDYITDVGLESIAAHEAQLLAYATEVAEAFEGLTLIGTANNKASVLSFILEQAHPHDIGTIVDMSGVAVRAGHHCAMPVMDYYGVSATARASFAMYNTRAEIDALFKALERVKHMFS